MTAKDATRASAIAEAARVFVRIDAGAPGAVDEHASWLAARPENERAFERVELAVALAKRLAAEPGSALHAEGVRAARSASRRRTVPGALAWGGALAAALLVAVLMVPDARLPDGGVPRALQAAQAVAVDAPSTSAVVLPAGAVVDASAVAVLPFVAQGDATLAAGLERDVVESLRSVPGLYVIAGDAVRPYADSELDVAEMGGQLGARGIVSASVGFAAGRVRVDAELRDAATGVALWRSDLERPVDELSAMRYEIAENVATAMLDAALREQSAAAGRASAPASFAKPLP
jgi:TolB-like protein